MSITCSCCACCRMSSFCLTWPAVQSSGSVSYPPYHPFHCRLPSACLPRSVSFSFARSASLLVGRDGLAMGVGSVCDYGGRADVVRLLAPRFACVPFSSRPAPSTRVAGRGTAVRLSLLTSFWLLLRCAIFVDRIRCGCHGCFAVIYLSRVVGGGRTSAIAVHRDSLACFSIPIFLSAL